MHGFPIIRTCHGASTWQQLIKQSIHQSALATPCKVVIRHQQYTHKWDKDLLSASRTKHKTSMSHCIHSDTDTHQHLQRCNTLHMGAPSNIQHLLVKSLSPDLRGLRPITMPACTQALSQPRYCKASRLPCTTCQDVAKPILLSMHACLDAYTICTCCITVLCPEVLLSRWRFKLLSAPHVTLGAEILLPAAPPCAANMQGRQMLANPSQLSCLRYHGLWKMLSRTPVPHGTSLSVGHSRHTPV